MSAETSSAVYLIAAAAAAQVVAQPTEVPLGDLQLLAVTIGAGLMGGLVATLNAPEELSLRHLAKRCIASGMVAPALVAGVLLWSEAHPTLFQAVATSCISGMVAWPCWEISQPLMRKLLPAAARKWIGGGDD